LRENHDHLIYLGLDTSAYTTSLAVVDRDERLIIDSRLPLAVEAGSLGLRQSEAVFSHIKNLPLLWEGRANSIEEYRVAAAAASTRPRPLPDSYMPVFKVSEAFGLFLAQTMGLNFLPSSHQEGHIMAGLWSAGLKPGRYLCVHLSGGTTEIVAAEEIKPGCLEIRLLGGGSDLNAGQFIDRLGRMMELGFPAGPQLEILARTGQDGAVELPVAVKGAQISFSGPATRAEQALREGWRKEDVARAIETCIADSLAAAITSSHTGGDDFDGVLAVGGVMANRYIRDRLAWKMESIKLFFAAPEFASDNAVGLAVQAARRFRT